MGYESKVLKMEETELRLGLGLPGGSSGGGTKRGRAETETSGSGSVDLSLNLTFSKQALMDEIEKLKENKSFTATPNKPSSFADPSKPLTKAQVVGWPPVRASRKSMVVASQAEKKDEPSEISVVVASAAYVKVSMDGAPYMRKVDLNFFKSYEDLSDALVKLFDSFISGSSSSQPRGMMDFMNKKKSVDLLNGSDYVSAFEDKDGDWMLVGDVPWPMFVDSCKRLRIMKGADAIGQSPRAEESSTREGKTVFHGTLKQHYDRQAKVFLTK